jgi:PIN domain nuclease of toxin-antitoxin system
MEAIESSQVVISPMVLLELQYLYEISRILQPPQLLFRQLSTQIGLHQCEHPFSDVIETSLFENWTRDPFDRVIVAQARSNGISPLITSDTVIHKHYSAAIW